MTAFYDNASRARLFWLALHTAYIAVLSGWLVTTYVEDWHYVSDTPGQFRTIAGGCAWAIASTTAGITSLLCIARLPRRPSGSDTLGNFSVLLVVEGILFVLTGMILDTGVLQSYVVGGSLIVNLIWLTSPQLTNKLPDGK